MQTKNVVKMPAKKRKKTAAKRLAIVTKQIAAIHSDIHLIHAQKQNATSLLVANAQPAASVLAHLNADALKSAFVAMIAADRHV